MIFNSLPTITAGDSAVLEIDTTELNALITDAYYTDSQNIKYIIGKFINDEQSIEVLFNNYEGEVKTFPFTKDGGFILSSITLLDKENGYLQIKDGLADNIITIE